MGGTQGWRGGLDAARTCIKCAASHSRCVCAGERRRGSDPSLGPPSSTVPSHADSAHARRDGGPPAAWPGATAGSIDARVAGSAGGRRCVRAAALRGIDFCIGAPRTSNTSSRMKAHAARRPSGHRQAQRGVVRTPRAASPLPLGGVYAPCAPLRRDPRRVAGFLVCKRTAHNHASIPGVRTLTPRTTPDPGATWRVMVCCRRVGGANHVRRCVHYNRSATLQLPPQHL